MWSVDSGPDRMNVSRSNLTITESLWIKFSQSSLTTLYSPFCLILTVQAVVDPTYGRNGRPSGDNELVKVALGVGGLWLGEKHVHDVQSRQPREVRSGG